MDLYLSKAIAFVRSRLDELSFSNDDMILPAEDDRNFDTTVEKLLPEAAEYIYRTAPAELLEPQKEIYVDKVSIGRTAKGIDRMDISDEGIIFVVIKLSSGFLRLVSFRCTDSPVYLTAVHPFNGPEARMQTNPFIRGTWDDPVLVERNLPGEVEFRYFTARYPDEFGNKNAPGFYLEKIDVPTYVTVSQEEEDDGGSQEGPTEEPPLPEPEEIVDDIINDEIVDGSNPTGTSEAENEIPGNTGTSDQGAEPGTGLIPESEDEQEGGNEEEEEEGSGVLPPDPEDEDVPVEPDPVDPEPSGDEETEPEPEPDKYIFCPTRLELPVLNRLVAMVLDTYKENQLAQTFYQKSANYFA